MVVAVTDLNAERKKHVKQQALHSRLQRDLADVQSQLQGAFLLGVSAGYRERFFGKLSRSSDPCLGCR